MEFITVEEFLSQDKIIQDAFFKWWKPSYGDIFAWVCPIFTLKGESSNQIYLKTFDEDILSSYENGFFTETCHCYNSLKDFYIPLLTEGQLKKFIEEKTSKKCDIFRCMEDTEYMVYIYNIEPDKENGDYRVCDIQEIKHLGHNALQALWKAACSIVSNIK